MGFYDRFSGLCKDRGVSPSSVAKAIGITTANPTYWKRGSIPKGETLQKLADYFNTSVDFLLDLSPEDASEMNYIEDYVVRVTGRKRSEVHQELIEQKISDIPFETFRNASDLADHAVLEYFKTVPDSQLKKYLLDDYHILNRRGRIEAVIRIAELAETRRFHDLCQSQPPSAPLAPDPIPDTPEPQEAEEGGSESKTDT